MSIDHTFTTSHTSRIQSAHYFRFFVVAAARFNDIKRNGTETTDNNESHTKYSPEISEISIRARLLAVCAISCGHKYRNAVNRTPCRCCISFNFCTSCHPMWIERKKCFSLCSCLLVVVLWLPLSFIVVDYFCRACTAKSMTLLGAPVKWPFRKCARHVIVFACADIRDTIRLTKWDS